MRFLYSLYFVGNLFYVVSGNHFDIWTVRDFRDETHNKMVEYHYYTGTKVSWNEARTVCQEIGGDLAKIDSKRVMDMIVHVAEETYLENILYNYWVGLIAPEVDQRIWTIDCSPLGYIENFQHTSRGFGQCFVHRISDMEGKNKDCSKLRYFLCEKRTTHTCALEPIRIASHVVKMSNTSANACTEACQDNDACQGVLTIPPADCFTFRVNDTELNTTATSPIIVSSKLCFKVVWNQTSIDPPKDPSSVPNHDCDLLDVSIASRLLTSSTASLFTSTTTLLPEVVSTSKGVSQIVTTSCVCQSLSTLINPSPTCGVSSSSFNNLTHVELHAIAEEISRNLTVAAKNTSAYSRKLTSVGDTRTSSAAMGIFAVFLVTVPLLLIVIADVSKIFLDIPKRCKP